MKKNPQRSKHELYYWAEFNGFLTFKTFNFFHCNNPVLRAGTTPSSKDFNKKKNNYYIKTTTTFF